RCTRWSSACARRHAPAMSSCGTASSSGSCPSGSSRPRKPPASTFQEWRRAERWNAPSRSRLGRVTSSIELTGEDLTLADVWDVAVHGAAASLSPLAHDRMRLARELLESIQGEHTYGVNTGFGRFVSARIPDELTEELQVRLLRSHACGVGEPYP